MRHEHDFLILGTGVAGLSFALQAARHGSVAVLSKRGRSETNTAYAQGGIAAVLGPQDTFEQHIQDTLVAGAGLCREDAVRVTVSEGPSRVRELIDLGAEFTREATPLGYHLTREGGHSQRRVLHAADMTGREVERTLLAAAEKAGVQFFEEHDAIDLLLASRVGASVLASRHAAGSERVMGAYALDTRTNQVHSFTARAVVLATGGAGKVYTYTTNPDVATGDGLAMAHRAGAAVANLEFIQFHPTCLYHPQAKNFLISEALRGEGGILRNKSGEAFMARYDPRRELAPRDVVARSIDSELKRRGDDCAFLDMTHLGKAFLVEHFPHIYTTCAAFGIDMAVTPIPVVPAAHYVCGGVCTDLHGRTTLPGLFAVGEVACTGLHGANRLASNSLLEGLVFGHRAAAAVKDLAQAAERPPAVADWDPGSAVAPDEGVIIKQNWDEIRHLMWNYVGIVRTDKRLARAERRLDNLVGEIQEYYWGYLVDRDVLELRNLADVARLIVACAQERKESRGLHYTLSWTGQVPPRDTVLVRGKPDPSAWPR
ncbi:MAG TPA: L-aspartate oxidase [Myxococcales bacterium]|nr:L-aspartate oxidase [Myxococcales bacterium]